MKLLGTGISSQVLCGLLCFLWLGTVHAAEVESPETTTQKIEPETPPAEPKEAEIESSDPAAEPSQQEELADNINKEQSKNPAQPETTPTGKKPTLSERVQIFIPSEEIDTEKAVAFPTNI